MYFKSKEGKELFVRHGDLIKIEGAKELYPVNVFRNEECGPWVTVSEWNGGFGEQVYLQNTDYKFQIINR